MALSQWDRLLKNVGVWQGSFTRISADGQILEDIPTEVSLEARENDTLMHQEVHKYPVGKPPEDLILDYRTLGRSLLFFENGAFSNGSMQWGPYTDFGAEQGLIDQNRRLRLVQFFGPDTSFKGMTLIRECLAGATTPERPPLQVSDLLGTWEGEAITLDPSYLSDRTQKTMLTVEQVSAHEIRQTLTLEANQPLLTSVGTITDQVISFPARDPATSDPAISDPRTQVVLLPDGASSTTPVKILPRQAFFLEVGWLLAPNLRQRLIRRYGEQGDWVSVTLVTEQKR